MAIPISSDASALRANIHAFIDARLQDKLDKLKDDEHEQRAKLREEHRPAVWLESAAKRVSQIQLATHTLKPIHPDARGTNLHVRSPAPELNGLVSSRILQKPDDDVVGNAAALDVFKLLKLEHAGQTLLQRVLAGDPQVASALADDPQQGEAWSAAFAGIVASKGTAASHTLARQLYFPLDDGSYHLLAPLFPTSLIHRLQRTLRNDRFGDAAKAAREARKDGKDWPQGYCEYPDMAIRKFGGTKPQNISQLNSERYGENWLLASLPPQWQSTQVRVPLGVNSVVDRAFGGQRQVRELTGGLREFLQGTERNNRHIRRKRAAMVAGIVDELLQYAACLQALEPGWSERDDCLLHPAERRWLDPRHPQEAVPDWQEQVSHRFGNWLNHVLGNDPLRLDEDVHGQWKRDLLGELQLLREVLDDEA
jgi:CRISPR-associated protein Csy1